MTRDTRQPGARVPWRWLGWTIRVRDDRGVVMPCKGIHEHRYAKEGDLSSSDLHSSSYPRAINGAGKYVVYAMVYGVVPALAVAGALFAARHAGISLKYTALALFVGGGVAFMLVNRMMVLRWTAEAAVYDRRDKLIAEGKCLSCGYSLATIAPDTDGCTVCPECGAAWRVNESPER